MPLDDRDRTFERALGAHLHAACPDAETLASYHERSLTPDEMTLWKKHIAGCAACQEVLSALEASEHVVPERERELVLTTFEHPSGGRKAARAALEVVAQVNTIPHQHELRAVQRRGGAWRWAAPAGAIAAGLLVFAVVTEMHQSVPVVTPGSQINAKPALAAPPDAKSESNPASAGAREKELASAPALASKTRDVAHANSATQNAKAQPEANPRILNRDELSRNALDSARNEVANERLQAKVEPKDEEVRKKAVAGLASGPAPQSVQQQMATAQKQALSAEAATSPTPAPAAAPQQRGTRDDKALEASAVAGAATSGQLQEVVPGRKSEYLRASNVAALPVVSSSDHQSVWRVGLSGTILYSSDQGGHWKPQTSGVTTELISGSAPSAEVCWIVGKQGTILRTVNGGQNWVRISSPIPGDLGGIQASDALHSRIWDADRKASFETADGGKTWKQISGE
jgi:Photosynthesis system II assembly factor YCF48